jgi:hypothetical protein
MRPPFVFPTHVRSACGGCVFSDGLRGFQNRIQACDSFSTFYQRYLATAKAMNYFLGASQKNS